VNDVQILYPLRLVKTSEKERDEVALLRRWWWKTKSFS